MDNTRAMMEIIRVMSFIFSVQYAIIDYKAGAFAPGPYL